MSDNKEDRRKQLRQAIHRLFERVPLWLWLLLCLFVAVFYVVIWPSEDAPNNVMDWRYIVLRWFHPLAWIILSISILIRMSSLPDKHRWANRIALLAAPTYALFFFTVATS